MARVLEERKEVGNKIRTHNLGPWIIRDGRILREMMQPNTTCYRWEPRPRDRHGLTQNHIAS